MTLDYYALYLLLAIGTVLSPGPAVIYTIGNTLTRGTRHAIAGFCGVAVGILLVASLASLAVLWFTRWLAAGQQILTLGGAFYLLYLGLNAWRQRVVSPVPGAGPDRDCRRSFIKGALISLLNPKAIIFFTSLFPQFIDFRHGALGQCMLLAVTFSAVVLVVHGGYCLVFHWVGAQGYGERFARGINRLSAVMFTGFALLLLFKGLR
ncbi:lysine transporter LysE [Aeromonas hydrophila]|uniref:LysE family translocator n=1 Tax=Aeromonas hydrophila TaxID=644 RepID=A0AAX3P501_AERHY|nr:MULTISPECIES: LysE family translocator [Aeromonas]GKQ64465.1 lysine transporter LysE [Aeromonas caviae]HDT5860663.1 LysE family translocator [Aeromonas hydrophila subsp. hydrophila]MCO4116617.1 LysE family translocator [Aeromonas hydrophila]MCV9383562.1 LysE family translocator [Aeromonas hydrophila]MDD9227228.1 LysE family translocator [Aeromonas hydrophila]